MLIPLGIPTDRLRNRLALNTISLHLLEALRLCKQLDISDLGSDEQREYRDKVTICKNALEFGKDSIEKLTRLLT